MFCLMYGASSVCALGIDLEALDDRGVDRADHDARDDEQRGADEGQPPAADDGGDDEQHGDDRRDAGEDQRGSGSPR